MYNMPNNRPYGGRGGFGSRYQYQTLPQGYEVSQEQSASLISKVMGLLAFSFLFAAIGTFVGFILIPPTSLGPYLIVAIGGLVVLFILHIAIQKPGLNLFLLYLFTFLEGMALGPLVGLYITSGYSNIVGEAFLITAVTSLALSAYAWTTKRNFSNLGGYLFFGLILLIVAGIAGFFFHSTLFELIISVVGIAIFSGYVLFYVQRAKYMADTMPNAIGLTVSIFITVMNLFLYILEFLSIVQGGNRRR
ncbi:MAG TPA: Bax inhibitor-1/YccA family protein [Ktedonobacteraceae bacterium]|nr:Bax inhibitor-1/YccA family protein [Ktedonobacteraceae bacterium]